MPTRALNQGHPWRCCGYGSLATLMLSVAIGPCQAQVLVEAAALNFVVDSATLTAEIQRQIQNDQRVAATLDLATEVDVVTQQIPKMRSMRGGLTVTVGTTGYTKQQVIEFVTEMLVQALMDTPNTNVNAENITVSIDSNTSIRYAILSCEAEEDLAILDALSQSEAATVLQTILTDSNVDVTVHSISVDWEIHGTLVIQSAAVDAADQQKLTDSDAFSVTSMKESLSAYAQSTYGLTSLQVGFFLSDKIGYKKGVNTSNRIVVTYKYVPSTFTEYCNTAARQESAAQQAAMEAALNYTGVDATILPVFASFEQDPVLDACTLPKPIPPGPHDDDTATATAVIALIAVGAVLGVLGRLLAIWFGLRRRRTADPKEPFTSDDQEAQSHGTVPESTIQVTLPPANLSGTAERSTEARETGVHWERGAERNWDRNQWNVPQEFLDYLDDEPQV